MEVSIKKKYLTYIRQKGEVKQKYFFNIEGKSDSGGGVKNSCNSKNVVNDIDANTK